MEYERPPTQNGKGGMLKLPYEKYRWGVLRKLTLAHTVQVIFCRTQIPSYTGLHDSFLLVELHQIRFSQFSPNG